jgi:structure-specific endonuclease subunit SLX1
MILVVHGFTTNISALQFEWSWQHPQFARHGGGGKTTRTLKRNLENLRDLILLDRFKRSFFHVHFNDSNVYSSWLKITLDNPLPIHMEHGLGELKDIGEVRSRVTKDIREESMDCLVCQKDIDVDSWLQCDECGMKGHIICWARSFLGPGSQELIPVKGKCEFCESELIWGKIILDKKSILN